VQRQIWPEIASRISASVGGRCAPAAAQPTAADRFAVKDQVVFNGGAYAGAKPVPWLLPGGFSKTPYRIPHARTEFITVYTNTVPAGHEISRAIAA